jgi:acetyltransferase-like isoleucine patch superfamily enzyme
MLNEMMKLFFKTIRYLNRKIWWTINKNQFKHLGKNTYFKKGISISKKYITCGVNIYVWNNCRMEAIVNHNGKKFNPNIILDDCVTIQQNLHLTCADEIYIGKNTAIAANVTITDINHPYEDVLIPIEYQDIEVKKVSIAADCKIYNNVVILPGTIIGTHCTVGANSVVAGTYPDFCVIAGIPAIIIKQYNHDEKKWLKIKK